MPAHLMNTQLESSTKLLMKVFNLTPNSQGKPWLSDATWELVKVKADVHSSTRWHGGVIKNDTRAFGFDLWRAIVQRGEPELLRLTPPELPMIEDNRCAHDLRSCPICRCAPLPRCQNGETDHIKMEHLELSTNARSAPWCCV